ncbi:MAG: DinB family protein [Bacteroidota bacterium]|nr:DinB family protein [Flavisolibacter sp.]MBD0349670.1 DinB family protein [Flavisolibacter sp.]MBD0374030.1 DinB family protein [Flavisolibacter sp.]MDQ3842682.1 DinB family protein [Bacteroidota bacterium]
MTFIEFFRKQFTQEGETTRKMLSRVPNDHFDYKPHLKSMDLKRLVVHLADLPGWIHMTFTTDELDFAEPYEQPQINNTKELMAFFEKRYHEGLLTLVPENEAQLDKPWTLRRGDIVYSTEPKIDIVRMSISQQIHHRAQLGVYLRLLDIPIPGSYGPSADESVF